MHAQAAGRGAGGASRAAARGQRGQPLDSIRTRRTPLKALRVIVAGTVCDISAHLAELYGVQIGRDAIRTITDAVLEHVDAWRTRPLERVYR